jgi:hypothetical protein
MKSTGSMHSLAALVSSPHEVWSWLAFRYSPARAKLTHLRRVGKNGAGRGARTVTVLGTIHYDHVGNRAYPLADLRAAEW